MSHETSLNQWFESLCCRRQIQRSLDGKHDHLAAIHKKQLPNFIVIGAAKSATTSLVTALKRHPNICISRNMEPKFFGRHYIRGWDWYASQFRGGEKYQLRGEASTMYTSSFGSYQYTPQLIRHHLGDIPLIYLVRHPLRRIESHWRHWKGRVNCPAFEDLLSSHLMKRRIIDASLYNKQLERYRRWFPDKSILCITTEELTSRPQSTLRKILDFLGTQNHSKKLLNHGQLPLVNIAGSKGRKSIDPPKWPINLKEKTIALIKPDTEAFLKGIQRPLNTWEWD